jgi:hypothetical protein
VCGVVPTSGTHLVNKTYVDAAISGVGAGVFVRLDGDTMSGVLEAPDVIITSDRTLKDDLQKVEKSVTMLKQITGYTYVKEGLEGRHAGVIAQDVQKVLPEAVILNKQTGKLGVSESALMALVINAVNDLATQIEAIKGAL